MVPYSTSYLELVSHSRYNWWKMVAILLLLTTLQILKWFKCCLPHWVWHWLSTLLYFLWQNSRPPKSMVLYFSSSIHYTIGYFHCDWIFLNSSVCETIRGWCKARDLTLPENCKSNLFIIWKFFIKMILHQLCVFIYSAISIYWH